MKPVMFPHVNVTYAKDQPQYLPLPAHRSDDGTATVTTCWKLSFRERVRVFVTGKFYFQQMTFGDALQPQRPDVKNPLSKGAK